MLGGRIVCPFQGAGGAALGVLEESLPDMLEPFRNIQEAVGRNTPQGNLEMALTGIYRFQTRVAPLFAGLFAEPELLRAFRRSLTSQDKGPQLSIGAIASYIEAEQKLGRMSRQIDANVCGQLLVGSTFFRAFVEHFFDKPLQPSWANFAKELVAIISQKHLLE